MSEQGGPHIPAGQQQPGQGWTPSGQGGPPPGSGWQQPGQAPGPQGWQQPGQAPGPQGWQQPGQAPGPQGWQQPGQAPGPQGWQQPGQAPGPQGWQQPGQAPGPQGWQQPGQTPGQPQQAGGPQGWQQPRPTQSFPPQGPGGAPGQWTGGQPAGNPPANNSRKPIIITAIAVVVALIAGAGIYFFAIRDSNSTASGAGSPQDSVTALFSTLSNSDPIGLADQLDPVEAGLFTDLNSDVISELKRLNVLSPEASANSMTGTTITVSNLTFDGSDETINDNLRIVKLTGGTITITSDPNNIPLSETFKDAFSTEIEQAQPQTQTVNIADAVAENDNQPLRVASVKRDGGWYVSLFYTIADNAAHQAGLANPNPADRIPDDGKGSPQDAATAFIEAATEGRVRDVIGVLPPDEMGVLHDYGSLFIDQGDAGSLTSGMTDLGISVSNVTWDVSDVTGGKKVSIKSLDLTADGQTVTILRDGDSLTLSVPGEADVTLNESTIDSFLAESTDTSDLDQQALDIIKREFKQLIGVGLVTVEVNGEWYVSPIRSVSDIFVSLLKGLEPGDIDYLISLANK